MVPTFTGATIVRFRGDAAVARFGDLGPRYRRTRERSLYRTIIADGVEIASDEHFENAAIVRADMVRSCKEIPEKALKGYIQGENYIVPLN